MTWSETTIKNTIDNKTSTFDSTVVYHKIGDILGHLSKLQL